MISQERFNEIEMEHGCGYWGMCWEHACPCAISIENKGLREDIYNGFIEENKKIKEEFDEYEYNNVMEELLLETENDEEDVNEDYWDDGCPLKDDFEEV
jgi:hypothetical protein